MLRALSLTPILAVALTLATVVATDPGLRLGSAAEPPAWSSDTSHSNLGFSVPIMGGLAAVDGKFSSFKVELNYDPAEPETATVTVDIDAASIDTGIDKRDGHLRTADFFDVENHPRITFVSKTVKSTKDGLTVSGEMSLHGVTKDMDMTVVLTGDRKDDDGKVTALGFTGTLLVNRRDFGIDYTRRGSSDFIGDEIVVTVRLLSVVPREGGGR